MIDTVTSRLPLSIAEVFPKLGLTAEPAAVPSILGGVEASGTILEDFAPITESLEWRLAAHQWYSRGLLPFVDGEVPFWINNTGRLSEDAAVLLFTFCEETKVEGEIRVVEFGAGTGLFARYLLDDFEAICKQEHRDYYQRVRFLVTDLSETTVEQWRERGLFAGHEGRVRMLASAAENVPVEQAHAVFANYVFDVLPATVVEWCKSGEWKELRVRTRWQGDASALEHRIAIKPDELKAWVSEPANFREIDALIGDLDLEARLFPFEPTREQSVLLKLARPGRQSLNHGAAAVLQRCLRNLHPNGFVLVNDYGVTKADDAAQLAFCQRFGRTAAIGLNFPLLTAFAGSLGAEVVIAPGDDNLPIHSRLIGKSIQDDVRSRFLNRFCAETRTRIEPVVNEARQHAAAGRRDEALKAYTRVLEIAPRDWSLLGETADFVGLQLNDAAAGLELARGAVQRNPWYSAWLWNILGDCLYGLRRTEEAHEAYLQAERIDPKDARTNLNLSFTLLAAGNYEGALTALARGLGGDRSALFRDRLLAKQAEVLAAMSRDAAREAEQQQRRVARLTAAS